MIEAQLYTWLRNDPAVAALVADRIYPVLAVPAGEPLPIVSYQRISSESVDHLKGTTTLASARIQISGTASGYSNAKALAEAIRIALDSRRGGDVEVVRLASESDAPAVSPEGGPTNFHTVHLDFRVWYRRPLPLHSS